MHKVLYLDIQICIIQYDGESMCDLPCKICSRGREYYRPRIVHTTSNIATLANIATYIHLQATNPFQCKKKDKMQVRNYKPNT